MFKKIFAAAFCVVLLTIVISLFILLPEFNFEKRVIRSLDGSKEFLSFYTSYVQDLELNIILYQTTDLIGCSVYNAAFPYEELGIGLQLPFDDSIDSRDILSAGIIFTKNEVEYIIDFGAIINQEVRTVLYNGIEEILMHTQNGYTMFFSVQEKNAGGIRPREIIYFQQNG